MKTYEFTKINFFNKRLKILMKCFYIGFILFIPLVLRKLKNKTLRLKHQKNLKTIVFLKSTKMKINQLESNSKN